MSTREREKRTSPWRERIKQDIQRQKDRFKSFTYLNLPEGIEVFKPVMDTTVQMDIFPYVVSDPKHPDEIEKGSNWYKRPFYVHRNIGSGNGQTIVCPKTFGKRCPICEFRDKRIKDGDASKKELDDLKNSQRNLYNIRLIDFDEAEYKGYKKDKLYIFDISWHAFQDRLNKTSNKREEYMDFPDPEFGYTLEIDFEAKSSGGGKPYPFAGSITMHKRESYEMSIIDESVNLDSIFKVLSYEEIHNLFWDGEDLQTNEDPEQEQDEPKKEVEERNFTRSRRREEKSEEEPEQTPSRRRSQRTDNTEQEPEKPSQSTSEQPELPEEWNDLLDMTQSRLYRLCRVGNLEVNPNDFNDDVNALRVAIAKELNIELPKTGNETKRNTKEKENKQDGEKCPHGLHFGIDTETSPKCDRCAIWNDCADEKDRLARVANRRR